MLVIRDIVWCRGAFAIISGRLLLAYEVPDVLGDIDVSLMPPGLLGFGVVLGGSSHSSGSLVSSGGAEGAEPIEAFKDEGSGGLGLCSGVC